MPTLSEIFDKRKILLYQNESLGFGPLLPSNHIRMKMMKSRIWASRLKRTSQRKFAPLICPMKIGHILASAILWMVPVAHTK